MIVEPTPFNLRFMVKDDDGTPLGEFVMEHYNARVSSIHTRLFPQFIGKGYGRQMYDEAERMLKAMGRILVPSPSLSPYSTRFWQKRAPHLLKYHTARSYNGGMQLHDRRLYIELDPTPRWMFWRRSWWYQFRRDYWPI